MRVNSLWTGKIMMGNMEEVGATKILAALTVWTGWGKSKWPLRDHEAVKLRFGSETTRLFPILVALAADFYSTNARHVAANLSEMGEMAVAEFRRKHAELPEQIGEILAWCYTFDFK
jgi:hypothetical protein